MPAIAELKSADHLFYVHPVSVQDIASPELKEESFTRTLPYGTLEYKQWCFEGIRIRYTRNLFSDHFLFENRNNLDVVGLEFNLRGNYVIHHYGNTYYVNSRRHNIIYSPNVHNTFENKDLQGETFVIQFLPEVFMRIVKESNDVLKRFADQMMEGKPVVIAKVSPLLNAELYRPILDILQCRFTGGLKKIFLLSKCMEILVMQAEAINKMETHRQQQKKPDDTERIMFAREQLIENIQNPPSLTQLSKMVGINEYKLKRGFKETFQNTVFGYLSDHRLELAREALLENHRTISEIAYDLGYSSPQHFSAAFRKKYGMPPRALKK